MLLPLTFNSKAHRNYYTTPSTSQNFGHPGRLHDQKTALESRGQIKGGGNDTPWLPCGHFHTLTPQNKTRKVPRVFQSAVSGRVFIIPQFTGWWNQRETCLQQLSYTPSPLFYFWRLWLMMRTPTYRLTNSDYLSIYQSGVKDSWLWAPRMHFLIKDIYVRSHSQHIISSSNLTAETLQNSRLAVHIETIATSDRWSISSTKENNVFVHSAWPIQLSAHVRIWDEIF